MSQYVVSRTPSTSELYNAQAITPDFNKVASALKSNKNIHVLEQDSKRAEITIEIPDTIGGMNEKLARKIEKSIPNWTVSGIVTGCWG